jgi:hypothetical protein
MLDLVTVTLFEVLDACMIRIFIGIDLPGSGV